MTEITTNRTAHQIREDFCSGRTTAREIVEEVFGRIQASEPHVKAFITLMEEEAVKQACRLDKKREKASSLGALAGVPIAVKDNLCTQGVRTTCASRTLEDFTPPYDAYVVERLRKEDAIIIGKTNMDEFAMGSSTENSSFQLTRNPWNTDMVPGGSSGGSAAAVAARVVPIALGSDTAGSVRQPSALCGVMGLKPTYGRVSRYGLVAFASSMDQVGPIAWDAGDLALLLEVISTPDGRDSTCTERPVPDYRSALKQPVKGMTFGVPREFFDTPGLSDDVKTALEESRKVFESLGVKFKEISLPHSRIEMDGERISSVAVACYYILCTAEAGSNLARFDGVRYGHRSREADGIMDMYIKSRTEAFGDEVKRRIMLGTHALSSGYYDAYYLKASKVRRLIADDFERAFDNVDIVFAPTTPSPAFKIGEKTEDPLEMYLNDVFTSPCNLAGNCAVSVPCGISEAGLPLGLQLLGPSWGEEKLLSAACAHQQNTGWSDKTPEL